MPFVAGFADMTHDEQCAVLRGLCNHMTPKAMLEVIASACDDVIAARPGKPAGTYASINANILRLAMERMIDAPPGRLQDSGEISP